MKEKEESEMKKYLKHTRNLICLVIFILGYSLFWLPSKVEATENIQITACDSVSDTSLILKAIFPNYVSGTYEIYRGTSDPSSGGTLQLIDTISSFGNSWTSQNGSDWYTYGDNDNIIFFRGEDGLSGQVLFGDAGVKIGQTYFYQVVLKKDSLTSDENAIFSNVISGQTKLETPEIIKCYSCSNKSVKISWTKVSSAKGYELYRQTGKTWKKIKTLSKASYTNKSLKAGKTYKYKVRAYANVNKKKIYSDFSKTYKIIMKKPTVKGTYTQGSVYGPSLTTSKLLEVRRVVQSFKDNYIRKNMSDYEKVWMAFTYIRANCDYAWKGWQYNGANTAWGALVYGEAQCSGYARGMKALCDAIGVPCYYVHANSKAYNPSHQWNMVKVDGKWYILDAQGGFFLMGSKFWKGSMGMYWTEKGLPKCCKTNHPKGKFVSSEI